MNVRIHWIDGADPSDISLIRSYHKHMEILELISNDGTLRYVNLRAVRFCTIFEETP